MSVATYHRNESLLISILKISSMRAPGTDFVPKSTYYRGADSTSAWRLYYRGADSTSAWRLPFLISLMCMRGLCVWNIRLYPAVIWSAVPVPHSACLQKKVLRWLPGYENGRSAQIFAKPVNGLWQNLIS